MRRISLVGIHPPTLDQGRSGAGINPFLDFTVTIGKCNASGLVVVAGGKVDDKNTQRRIRVAAHVNCEVSLINSILSFVNEHPGLRGWQCRHVSGPFDNFITPPPTGIKPAIHRHATHTEMGPTTVNGYTFVRRTFPDRITFKVGPKQAASSMIVDLVQMKDIGVVGD